MAKGCAVNTVTPHAQLVASGALLLGFGHGRVHHENHHGVIRPAGRLVTADAHAGGTAHPLKRVVGALEQYSAQLFVGAAIIQLHVGVDERRFDSVTEAFSLFASGHLRAEMRNQGVIASHNTVVGGNA